MTSEKKAKTVVDLIPWDPESEEHVKRMFDQRVVCGWKSNFVEKWKVRQREGTMTLQWVALRDDDPNTEARLAEHAAKYPNESSPITDTATSFGGKDRTPTSPPRSFIPVGHLSLDSFSETFPKNVDPANGVYTITSLYVSNALQSGGIGNAAMDTVETLAKGSPLYAKAITLDCIAARHSTDPTFFTKIGAPFPKVTVQDWYERRGYVVYDSREDAYIHVDPTLKGLGLSGVLMRKSLID